MFATSGFDFNQESRNASEIARFLYDENFSDKKDSTKWREDPITTSIESIKIDKKIFEVLKNMMSNSKKSSELVRLGEAMDSISQSISTVEENYETFLSYNEIFRKSSTPSSVIEGFADSILNPFACGLSHELSKIHSKLVRDQFSTNGESKVQDSLMNNLQDYSDICNGKKSMGMILSELYDVIVKAEIKALIVVNFAWNVMMMKYKKRPYDWPADLNLESEESNHRIEEIRQVLRKAALKASHAIWSCDPDTMENGLILGDTDQLRDNVYFNLHFVKTDVFDHMVMTGARFNSRKIKINGEKSQEIYIEIQQGQLMEDNRINASTLVWKNSLKVKNPKRHRLRVDETSVKLVAQDSVSDSIYLTGVELRIENGNTITLHTFGCENPMINDRQVVGSYEYFDYVLPLHPIEQGNDQNLKDLVSSLRKSDDSYSYITQFYMSARDPWNKITSHEKRKYTIQPDYLILNANLSNQCRDHQSKTLTRYYGRFTFKESPSDDEDEKQTVIVPFIDTQNVVTDPPTPLSGIALYHKGTKGCRNFLALEIRSRSFENRT
ncbi:hypothetical protein QAD02_006663 [Eretmocerus hayati]|uniref:Uncharacterized protein n=1 Tax=Eretmocerus hayati TaxID=131215 RepID=A0ACC2N1W0_9HYME|nr:hypothetical protein QAD02_006663 [Eretmocerus hayati]